ncbi:CDP-diacylglycerol-choline O-phosphatidyltransferase [Rhodopseudomonas palustris HaA2]|uniref:Phosphatidylcholine synthase n=1 Tax=Rhodopseudomonas palustris (strain HaA2) TaxID=316058 RepID=Q2IW66_RHOP2|nr:CDP-alcohol phosphatidyltransferase family protein [Rhodopseudomonas palustris]ABD07544.1 CDP-diacylglycerol-choline O-phosphatidyltransferase [Rhodopseudomonas palustris HaA2]
MSPLDQPQSPPLSRAKRMAAFSVHLLTAAGVGIALLALLEAVREHWAAMFGWLGLALLIDAIDGPLARRFDVRRRLPKWDGDVLDLVVDFVTYVFVPAYAITASGLLMPIAAPVLGVGIVISSALYFADRRMKTADNHFRGFPALWNAAAFYLFLLHPSPIPASLGIAALIVLTFVPINVLHPVRVARFRAFNLTLIVIWAALAVYAIMRHFEVPAAVTIVLCAIAVYIAVADAAHRLFAARSGAVG